MYSPPKTHLPKLSLNHTEGDFVPGESCLVHARAGALNENELVMTLQKLDLSGSDLFSNLMVRKSHDGGKTWTAPENDEVFSDSPPYRGEDAFCAFSEADTLRHVMCDVSHQMHKKTGKLLSIGSYASYDGEKNAPIKPAEKFPLYTVYDEKTGKFGPVRKIIIPTESVGYQLFCTGCIQWVEKDDGTLLIPMYLAKVGTPVYAVAVFHCSFDGETVKYIGVSNVLKREKDRGLCEPQLCFYRGKYYLSLRADDCGLWSVSQDGEVFSEPKVWTWDTGLELQNYNTQQHWLICGGKLYLVYTRRAGNNDHVFRNRAPLFIAQVDEENVCVLRHTEQIAVPERGARLGNFGITRISDNRSLIVAAEWMQAKGCERFGSDNTIFVASVDAE